MTIKKLVPEGEAKPRGYMVAYIDWTRREGATKVCYPIPINFIVKYARNFLYWLNEKAWSQSKMDRMLMNAASIAYQSGITEGRKQEKERLHSSGTYKIGFAEGFKEGRIQGIVDAEGYKSPLRN